MIGREHDERVVPEALRAQAREEASELRVEVVDLAVVAIDVVPAPLFALHELVSRDPALPVLVLGERELRLVGVIAAEGSQVLLRRRVGPVRILVVDPEEESSAAGLLRVEPPQRRVRARTGRALEHGAIRLHRGHLVVVRIESLSNADVSLLCGRAAQHAVRHDGRRRVARVAHDLGQRRHALGHQLAVVARRPRLVGHPAREQARERRTGQRRGGPGVLELELRRRRARVPVAAEVVGAQRVAGDQDHALRRSRGSPVATAGEEDERRECRARAR